MAKKANTKTATVNVNDFATVDEFIAAVKANPAIVNAADTAEENPAIVNAADTNAADTAEENPAIVNAADTNAADTNAADTNAEENPAIVDATNAAEVAENPAAIVDAMKVAKLRGLPKGITLDNARIILKAIVAIKSGKTHNAKTTFIKGYSVDDYKAFMANEYFDVCGVDCVVVGYNGKNRSIVLATVLNDITISMRVTTYTQYPIRDLVAQGYQGEDSYGYADSIIKAIRNATEEKRVLVGTLSYNRVAQENFGLDCVFNRKCDINWLKKNNPELLAYAESIDVDTFKPAIEIDCKDVDKVIAYMRYLNQIIKNAGGNATPNQIAAASKVKALIG